MLAIWGPTLLFFSQGFEHAVVNMFLIPVGMMLGANVSVSTWWLWNQIPVTLGNLVGGMLFTGLAIYAAHHAVAPAATQSVPAAVPTNRELPGRSARLFSVVLSQGVRRWRRCISGDCMDGDSCSSMPSSAWRTSSCCSMPVLTSPCCRMCRAIWVACCRVFSPGRKPTSWSGWRWDFPSRDTSRDVSATIAC